MNGRVNEIREALNKLIKSKKYAVKAGPATQIEED
jgi:hypothetical protein